MQPRTPTLIGWCDICLLLTLSNICQGCRTWEKKDHPHHDCRFKEATCHLFWGRVGDKSGVRLIQLDRSPCLLYFYFHLAHTGCLCLLLFMDLSTW